jgi:hypothetical protein
MRKIYWRHPACLWRHWEVWKYHRSIDKRKGYKLRKRYEVTKKVQSYEKGTKIQKKVRSYEKDTKLLVTFIPFFVLSIYGTFKPLSDVIIKLGDVNRSSSLIVLELTVKNRPSPWHLFLVRTFSHFFFFFILFSIIFPFIFFLFLLFLIFFLYQYYYFWYFFSYNIFNK